jgi:hypothetical protein
MEINLLSASDEHIRIRTIIRNKAFVAAIQKDSSLQIGIYDFILDNDDYNAEISLSCFTTLANFTNNNKHLFCYPHFVSELLKYGDLLYCGDFMNNSQTQYILDRCCVHETIDDDEVSDMVKSFRERMYLYEEE